MSKAKLYMPSETLQDLIKSMEGLEVRYNEPLDLIWRLMQILERDLADIRWEYLEHLQDYHGVRITTPAHPNNQTKQEER
mgnify:CR=1 FL=1